MKKVFFLVFISMLFVVSAYSWEVNTHRLIDRKAIEVSDNLKTFLADANIDPNARFEDKYLKYYGTTYFDYITTYSGTMSKIDLDFKKYNYQDIIEAGTVLEDATFWKAGLFGVNGRFLNHFLNPQDGNAGFLGYDNALEWARGTYSANTYSLSWAYNHFFWAFQNGSKDDRRRELASMFVTVGHIMHLFNDMSVPAHVRNDPHNPDPLEFWMRGGEHHNGSTGFYIQGDTQAGSLTANSTANPFAGFDMEFLAEARATSEYFFSKDTIPFNNEGPALPTRESQIFPEMTLPDCTPPSRGNPSPLPDECDPDRHEYIIDRASKRKMAIVYYSELFHKKRITIDHSSNSDAVHEAYAEELIPRAIGNAAGFLNYFFRGRIRAVRLCDHIVVENRSQESFSDGKIHIYYDNLSTGQRTEIEGDELPLDIDFLGSGESIEIPLSEEQQTTLGMNKIIAVYKGDIGGEDGVAVYSPKIYKLKREDWNGVNPDEATLPIHSDLKHYDLQGDTPITIFSERLNRQVGWCWRRYIQFDVHWGTAYFQPKVYGQTEDITPGCAKGMVLNPQEEDNVYKFSCIKPIPSVLITVGGEGSISIGYGIMRTNIITHYGSDDIDMCFANKIKSEVEPEVDDKGKGFVKVRGNIPRMYRNSLAYTYIDSIKIVGPNSDDSLLESTITIDEAYNWEATIPVDIHTPRGGILFRIKAYNSLEPGADWPLKNIYRK